MSSFSFSTFSPVPPAVPCSSSSFPTSACKVQRRTISVEIKCFASVSKPKVVVTRERGKNARLVDALFLAKDLWRSWFYHH
ncbi:hypothetical protein OROHE_008670 [Orobanche hederae]